MHVKNKTMSNTEQKNEGDDQRDSVPHQAHHFKQALLHSGKQQAPMLTDKQQSTLCNVIKQLKPSLNSQERSKTNYLNQSKKLDNKENRIGPTASVKNIVQRPKSAIQTITSSVLNNHRSQ